MRYCLPLISAILLAAAAHAQDIRLDPSEDGGASLLHREVAPEGDPAKSPPPFAVERDSIGSVVFYGPRPYYGLPTDGGEMTAFRQFDDFVLNQSTRLQSVRFWTIQPDNVTWDGNCFYQVFANGSGNLPGGASIASGFVEVRRRFIGVTSDNLDVYVNDFDLPSLTLSSGRYWIALRMSGDCSGADSIFWLRGAPSFGFNALADNGCDGTVADTGLNFSFQIFGAGSSGPLCQDLENPNADTFFTDESQSSSRIGTSDRALAIQMNTTVAVTSLGILGQIGQSTTLNVTIRALTGASIGSTLAQGSAAFSAGSVGFYDVPVSFTFQAGQRYDIAFNVNGGWGNPSPHILEFIDFDNPSLSSGGGYNAGAFKVLDGRSGSDGYSNSVAPRLRACLASSSFDAYGLDLENQKLVAFDLAEPETLTYIAALPFASNWTGCDFRPGDGATTLFTLDDAGDRLYSINVLTGAITNIGAVTRNGSDEFTGLGFDPTTGDLYASGTTVGIRSSLYKINPGNGSTTYIGSSTTYKGLIGIAVNSLGVVFGIDIQANALVTINKSNGAMATVGSLGIDIQYTEGMDFDSSTGSLYAALVNFSNGNPGLYSIDTSTGAASLVGLVGTTYPGVNPGAPTLSSLAVAADVVATPTPSPTASSTPTISPTPTASLTPSISPTPTPFNNASFVADTIPVSMPQASNLFAGVTLSNNGNTTWDPAASYSLAVIDDPCGLLNQPFGRLPIDASATVAPGEFYQFVVPLLAPASAGSCTIKFRMVQEFVEFFGPTVSATINIVPLPNAAADWSIYE